MTITCSCWPSSFPPNQKWNGSELVLRHSWPDIFLYIVQHCNFCVDRIFIISDINMEYFELHGTGTVACKWRSILPNLCIILTWFHLSWYFDLFSFFIVLMFWVFFFERRALRLCDSAIWIERTLDFMLGYYYYYNYYFFCTVWINSHCISRMLCFCTFLCLIRKKTFCYLQIAGS